MTWILNIANPEAVPGLPFRNNTHSKSFSINKPSHYSSTRKQHQNWSTYSIVQWLQHWSSLFYSYSTGLRCFIATALIFVVSQQQHCSSLFYSNSTVLCCFIATSLIFVVSSNSTVLSCFIATSLIFVVQQQQHCSSLFYSNNTVLRCFTATALFFAVLQQHH